MSGNLQSVLRLWFLAGIFLTVATNLFGQETPEEIGEHFLNALLVGDIEIYTQYLHPDEIEPTVDWLIDLLTNQSEEEQKLWLEIFGVKNFDEFVSMSSKEIFILYNEFIVKAAGVPFNESLNITKVEVLDSYMETKDVATVVYRLYRQVNEESGLVGTTESLLRLKMDEDCQWRVLVKESKPMYEFYPGF